LKADAEHEETLPVVEQAARLRPVAASGPLASSLIEPTTGPVVATAGSAPVLAPQPFQVRLALRRHVPGVRTEEQVDAPPVVGHSGLVQGRQQLVEVQLALTERVVRAGVVLVER